MLRDYRLAEDDDKDTDDGDNYLLMNGFSEHSNDFPSITECEIR